MKIHFKPGSHADQKEKERGIKQNYTDRFSGIG
jgi:hypothetical protein